MPLVKELTRSFAGGEITPEMYGRLDNVKFQTGLALCRNAMVLPHGPVTKRPGLSYVNTAANSALQVRLIPFAFSSTQTMVLEFGHQYIRFHTQGATLLATPTAWSSSAAYVQNDLVTYGGVTYSCLTANTNSAPPSANWRTTAYSAGTTYAKGDLVISSGTTYYCIAPTTGNAPPNTTYWFALPSTAYQIPTTYASTDLFDLEYTQSADVITITHKGYPVNELRRFGSTFWTLTAPTLGATPAVPTTPTGTATAGTGTAYNRNMYYKVTMVTPDGIEESLASGYLMLANDLSLSGAKNVINWSAVTGAGTYRVYKAMNNPGRLYGYIGETSDVTFTDDNITADYSRNPPATTIRLDTAGNYPSAVGYYEQRRMFAGTANNPQTVYGTKSATESNLNASLPSNASDALSFTIKAQQQNAIRHLIPLNDLIALTVGGAWKIAAANNQALTPSNLSVRGQTFYGSNSVHPILTGSSCLYVETNGRRVRDLSFSWQAQVYAADDRSIMAPHLFNGYTLNDSAYSRSPDQVAWFVRSDGVLLGMSYVPEHQVFGWHQHVTDGSFESVCVVTENNEDILYALVKRTIGGTTKRMIERMSTRQFATQGDSFYVDSGGTYNGSPTTTITGLSWLEGKTLVALADGAVVKNLVVSSGAVTLPTAASKVQIGLPFVTDVQTLPMALESAMAGGQGTMKSVDYAYLRVNRTGILAVGPSSDRLNTIPPRTNENYDTPPRLRSEVLDLLVAPDITPDAQLWIQSADPTPLTLSAITMKVSVGG